MEVLLLHSFKYPFGLFLAFLFSLGKYEDVINVNDEPSFHNHISQSWTHEGLKSGQGVALSKEHDQGFIESIGCDECCLPFVPFLDANVVIPPLHVHLGEVLGSFQFVNEGQNEGEWVGILDHMFIEVPIVLARAESSILLLDEEERGGLR